MPTADVTCPIRVLWAVPRSASTAFERMVIERGDHTVLDEPFSAAYYYGPERRSDRFAERWPDPSYDDVCARIDQAAAERPVFVKEQAYQAGPVLGEDLLGRYVNSFLIRDPRWTVASFADKWPDVTPEEVGFEAIGEAYDIACALHEAAGEPAPVVIDTADLRADPPAMVEGWCDGVDLDYDEGALTWDPGMQPEWELWPDWYGGTAASTGFAPPSDAIIPELPPRLEAIEAECRPVYERLHSQRLRP
ncbi:MAG TPA: hypothetical protein PKA98_05620 [Acidimicrobiales bacterium]|nr:hypothetical protein [Acidimicrobiales bacterium]